jgi:hypothetical protein
MIITPLTRKRAPYRNITKKIGVLSRMTNSEVDEFFRNQKKYLCRRSPDEYKEFDYGMEAYKCEQVLKKRKQLDALYDYYSYVQWEHKYLTPEKKKELLGIINAMLITMEKEIGL